jgi:hypothetical protein
MSALGEVRLGNDFHERHAGAVEIHAAVAVEMRELADVFLQVRAGDADARNAPLNSNSTKPFAVEGLSYCVSW